MPYVPTDAVAFWTAVAATASTVAVIVTAFSTYFVWQTLQSQNDPKGHRLREARRK
jgi:heme/copper-type cytochrome/quinol oxidase subunit 2